jgi:Flp pilus assembly protein TadB
MQEFRIRPDGYAVIRKRTLIRFIPVFIITAIVFAVINLTIWKPDDPLVWYTAILFFTIFVCISIFRTLSKQKKFLQSFRITIEDSVITREQLNTEELTIYFHEVKEVTKSKAGSLFIRGLEKTDMICIPPEIENKEALEAILGGLKPIMSRSKDAVRKQKLAPFIALAFIALLVTVFAGTNKILVGSAAVLVIAGMIWLITEIRKSKNADRDTKNRVWIYFVFIAAILVTAFLKIFDAW